MLSKGGRGHAAVERRLARMTALGALATGMLLIGTVLSGGRFVLLEFGPGASEAERLAARESGLAAAPAAALLRMIAQCESEGDPTAVSASGTYRGKYQFDAATWATVGGSGDPVLASEADQDYRAQLLLRSRGPAPWPVCGRRALATTTPKAALARSPIDPTRD